MCGLVGIFGDLNNDSKDAFENMLHIDQLRGDDATGVAVIHEGGVAIAKNTVIPTFLFSDKRYIKAMEKKGIYGLMGHNRYGTKGKNNYKNAHPHHHGDIVLCHNGTLIWQEELPDHKQFENDSENIAHSINKIGIEETWKRIRGAAAIVYWDHAKKTLNFIRNDQRPLTFRRSKDGKQLIWASEAWMMWGCCTRNKIETEKDSWICSKNVLYSFHWDGTELKEETKELKEWTWVASSSSRRERWHNGAWGGMEDWYDGNNGQDWDDIENKPVVNNPQPIARLVPPAIEPGKLEQLLAKIRKKKLTLVEFRERYKNCCMCGNSLHDDFDESVIVDERAAICGDDVETAIDSGMDVNQLGA